MKQCKKCKLKKPKKDYSKCSNYKDGLYYMCKECKNNIDRANYHNNKELKLKKLKNYHKNKEKYKENKKDSDRKLYLKKPEYYAEIRIRRRTATKKTTKY